MLKLWGKPIFNWDFCKRKKYINRTRIGFRIIFEFLFILNEIYICNKKKKCKDSDEYFLQSSSTWILVFVVYRLMTF